MSRRSSSADNVRCRLSTEAGRASNFTKTLPKSPQIGYRDGPMSYCKLSVPSHMFGRLVISTLRRKSVQAPANDVKQAFSTSQSRWRSPSGGSTLAFPTCRLSFALSSSVNCGGTVWSMRVQLISQNRRTIASSRFSWFPEVWIEIDWSFVQLVVLFELVCARYLFSVPIVHNDRLSPSVL